MRARFTRGRVWAIVLVAAAMGLFLLSCKPSGWPELLAQLEREFPEVTDITPSELHQWMNDAHRRPPLLLDVREETEFAVSHLPGAQRLEPGSLPLPVMRGLPKETPIVVYCSVGYRSSQSAQSLLEKGYTNVVNLEGSIFAWANEGYEVVLDNRPAEKVHPYNDTWGVFLHKEYHPLE